MRPGPVIAVMALLAVVGCGRGGQELYAERGSVETEAAVPPDAPPAYLGRWSRSAGDCADHPFVFETRRIQAPSGSWCDVSDWQTSPAGYSLTTVCHAAGGDPTPGRLLVTVPAQSAGRALTVEGGPLEHPLALVRCPTGQAAAPAAGAG